MKSDQAEASIFISHASADKQAALDVTQFIESLGVRCWLPVRDIGAGQSWVEQIAGTIRSASLVVVILSEESSMSQSVLKEVSLAESLKKQIISVGVGSKGRPPLGGGMGFILSSRQWLEWSAQGKRQLALWIESMRGKELPATPVPIVPVEREASKTKGYLFISYSSQDRDFIDKFKTILVRRNYSYWDYNESQRDYHNALYKELEQKIEEAAAFVCIVSDHWRESDWPAAEYLYAREAQIPVFVLQAKPLKRPMPIILNQQTRIDFSQGFERASTILEHELDRKNL